MNLESARAVCQSLTFNRMCNENEQFYYNPSPFKNVKILTLVQCIKISKKFDEQSFHSATLKVGFFLLYTFWPFSTLSRNFFHVRVIT